jgi:peptidoglycan/LPS O-acetylase OafA/YrhL
MSAVTVPSNLELPDALSERATYSYRPDIDGLRGVAVLLVVLFHAVRNVFVGGFVGVDVFFVISGYLITSIIWRESRDGRFTLQNLYARRCRRMRW